MEAIVSVVAAQGRRLTARDCKTLCLATLGGLLEFYDFIIELHEISLGQGGGALELVAGKH